MNNLKEYILEKFKISKDIENSDIEENNKSFKEKYHPGDKCLILRQRGLRNQERIYPDVVKIRRITKTLVEFEGVTNISTINTAQTWKYKESSSDRENYISTSGTTASSMIITKDDSLAVLQKIVNNKKKLDFYDLLWKGGRKNSKIDNSSPLVEPSGSDISGSWKEISDEHLNDIEKALTE